MNSSSATSPPKVPTTIQPRRRKISGVRYHNSSSYRFFTVHSPEDITRRFAYFPVLHKFLGARSNIVPPVLTTGVGPQGRKVVHLQAPTHSLAIDPALQTPRRDRSTSPDDPSSPIEIPSSPLIPRTKPNTGGAANKSADLASTFSSAVSKVQAANPRHGKKSFEDQLLELQMCDSLFPST